jgi:hypothetical protein
VDTGTYTPVRPSRAERARTVLAASASVSVLWDGGRVDLLGCHQDDARGDVILTLEASSTLVRAALGAPDADLPVTVELTELCPVSARHRVRARMSLRGGLRQDQADQAGRRCVRLHLDVQAVGFEEYGEHRAIPVDEYRTARPDPLHTGAAEQLQHLDAHHQDAIALLSRLCGRAALTGATRVLPVALDRYGVVLRVERLRGHTDVRLGFRTPIETGAEAVREMRHLFAEAGRRRPCQQVRRSGGDAVLDATRDTTRDTAPDAAAEENREQPRP